MESHPHTRLTKFLPGSYQCKQGMVQPVAGSWYLWGRGTKIARVLRCTDLKNLYVELRMAQYVVYVEQLSNTE